jgi:hypothetical protein
VIATERSVAEARSAEIERADVTVLISKASALT